VGRLGVGFGFSGLNCVKSRVERTCARNSSVASSLVRTGTNFGEVFGIAGDLSRVHVSGADGAKKITPL
jgi:hypothetical protein